MMFKKAAFAFATLCILAITTAVQAASSSEHRLTAYIVDWVRNKDRDEIAQNIQRCLKQCIMLGAVLKGLPDSIQWDLLDHVHYAFAIPDSDGKLSGFDSSQLKSGKLLDGDEDDVKYYKREGRLRFSFTDTYGQKQLSRKHTPTRKA